jgi:hypothetical protein
MTSAADLVDLERYPIEDPTSPEGRKLVEFCRSELQTAGACRLHGFLRPEATETMAGEAAELAPLSYPNDDTHNVYFEDVDESLPEDDPRRMMEHTAQKAVAWDHIPQGASLRRFYEWDVLTDFIAAALGKEKLYRSADPLGACNITVFDEGDELGWHFDRSEFSVTLMLQKAEEGGTFEYVPNIRTPNDENYPAIRKLLLGSTQNVIPLPSEPGTLAFFHGRYAIHRVTPIKGSRRRMNAVLTYGEEPSMKLNEYTQQLFYGRTA